GAEAATGRPACTTSDEGRPVAQAGHLWSGGRGRLPPISSFPCTAAAATIAPSANHLTAGQEFRDGERKTPARADRAVHHGDVGALRLLPHGGHLLPVPDRQGQGRDGLDRQGSSGAVWQLP